jgi:DNA-binding transcriptional regulator/RsmH inhibitor MraZ
MDLKFLVYNNSCELKVDSQGRVNVPDDYLEFAEIERDMVAVGFGGRVQLWAKERHEEKSREVNGKGKELMSMMNSRYVPKEK